MGDLRLPAIADLQGAGYGPRYEFAGTMSLCPRGHSFFRDHRRYVVFCFAERADAARFMERFGGELIDPKDRPRWERPNLL